MSTAAWYFASSPSRLHLRPLAEVRHRNEQAFEELARGAVGLATSYDNNAISLSVRAGPSLDFSRLSKVWGHESLSWSRWIPRLV